MTGLSSRPVYFLRLNGASDPNVVVKGEPATAPFATTDEVKTSIKWGSKLMKNVNNESVNTKIMTPQEVAVFKRFALTAFPRGSKQFDTVAPGGPNYNWVKMPYVAGLSDAEVYENRQTDFGAIKKNIVKFSDEAIWTDLGKIVAVDVFNGNCDRFDTKTGGWVNKGNVMFLTGGPTKVIGLDTFDPYSEQSNLTKSGGFEELRKLVDPGQRRTFATAVVRSVGSELKRSLGKGVSVISLMANGPGGPVPIRIDVNSMPDLFLPYAASFEAGFAAGAADLKIYLQNKVRQYRTQWNRAMPSPNLLPPRLGQARARAAQAPALAKTIPQGVLDRMAYLGWMP